MPSVLSSTDDRDFFSIAVELKLLTAELAGELAADAAASGMLPAQLVLRKGLLDAVQIDIIETLLNPDDADSDFEILGLLGRGGMGVVYRVRQKSLDRVVALKTILVSQLSDPGLVTRFEREAKTLAKLQHPNIVAVYAFGRDAGRMYFVMELVEGQDVDQLIKQRKQLDEPTALGLTRQAAAGLAHATQFDIVHRDIKPANMLLVDPPAGFQLPGGLPMVKIADFGLAFLSSDNQAETRLTAANTTLGSPNYMAPEQIAGDAVDQRADIYALGASLYHMLAGQPPFQGSGIAQIIAQKLSGKFTPLHEVNPAVSEPTSQLVQEMMNHDPESRLDNYTSLMNRLEELLRPLQGSIPTQIFNQAEIQQPDLNKLERTLIAASKTTATAMVTISQRKHLWRWLASGILLVAVVVATLMFSDQWFGTGATEIPSRDMVRSGWNTPLFNGETLGSLPLSGGWVAGQDDEGARVIAGTSGTIRQPLLRTDLKQPRPLENYRLMFFVRLHNATAVELQFGIQLNNNEAGEREVLRITPTQLLLARRESDLGEPGTVLKEIKLNIGQDKLHVVQLEYQHATWWVKFDDQLIGTVSSTTSQQLPEFRLKVEEGPAWFSDLSVEELVPQVLGE